MAALKLSIFFIACSLSLVIFNPLTVESSKGANPTGHSAFSSLKHLEGCHKGQKVTGLQGLKRHFMKFGYLDDNYSLTDANGDEFDELLESAIKNYQANYHLKVTGTLDHDTIEKMLQPSCGNPDIINTTSSEMTGKKKHGRWSKFFHMTSHYEFYNGKPKWPKTKLTYSFRSSASTVVSENVLRSACAKAFKTWEDVSKFTFNEAPKGVSGDIDIGFHRGAHGDEVVFDGRGNSEGNILGHAFPPTRGVLHFDADENWTDNIRSSSEVDLQSVALHEIGHVLGLAHSYVDYSVMYRYFEYGTIRWDLTNDDIDGLHALYS